MLSKFYLSPRGDRHHLYSMYNKYVRNDNNKKTANMNQFYPPGYDGSLDGGVFDSLRSSREREDDNDRFNDDFADSIFEAPPTWAYSVQRQRRARVRFWKTVLTIVLISSLLSLIAFTWQN